MRAPSLLPGWTRAHVVTHVARNADALRNLVDWATTGKPSPMYQSPEQREADIDSGAVRSSEALREDAVRSSEQWASAAELLTPGLWDTLVSRTLESEPFRVRAVPLLRRIEVEVHHADLGAGYTAAGWPEDFTDMLIGRVQDDRADGPSMVLSSTDSPGLWKFGRGQGPEITGTKAGLAWWLIGRGDGSGLVSSAGVLPELTRWR